MQEVRKSRRKGKQGVVKMSNIQYLYHEGVEACTVEPLKVRLDGVVCGQIIKVTGGFQYFPKGSKIGGDIFKNVGLVQLSLEADIIKRDIGKLLLKLEAIQEEALLEDQ